eukprot:TRINITY_DN9330_c0_g1_i1.p1 TRINITY_DN9330_c0_g1~~TRINITY_DN9330_c0_g1_i1.p1  ORF type:complete len:525 (-),score=98.48 TRINITY_DN9330_c0_g1_i1:527-1972(-)
MIKELLIDIGSQMGQPIIIKHYVPELHQHLQRQTTFDKNQNSVHAIISILDLFDKFIWKLPSSTVLKVFAIENILFTLLLDPYPSYEVMEKLSSTICSVSERIGKFSTANYIYPIVKQYFDQFDMILKEELHNLDDHYSSYYTKENRDKFYQKFKKILNEKSESVFSSSVGYSNENIGNGNVPDWISNLNVPTDSSWNVSGDTVHVFKEHLSSIKSLAVSLNERHFSSGGKDGFMKLWNVTELNSSSTFSHKGAVSQIEFLEDNLISLDSQLRQWHSGGDLLWISSSDVYTCFTLSNEMNCIIAGTSAGQLDFIQKNSGSVVNDWTGTFNQVSMRSVVSLGNIVACGFSSGMITLFESRTGQILQNWKAHTGPVTKLSKIDKYLISSGDGVIELWDISYDQSPLPIKTIRMREGNDFTVFGKNISSFSPNKLYISDLVENKESTIRIQKNAHKMAMTSITAMPYHNFILAGNESGAIKVIQ